MATDTAPTIEEVTARLLKDIAEATEVHTRSTAVNSYTAFANASLILANAEAARRSI